MIDYYGHLFKFLSHALIVQCSKPLENSPAGCTANSAYPFQLQMRTATLNMVL
jgi:hypothetical protein